MALQIQISAVTGTPPYQIEVCDITNTICILVTGSTIIPPTFTFNVPFPLENTGNLLIKITDSNGCETFKNYSCSTTTTSTTTTTTTTIQPPCNCIEVIALSIEGGHFDFTDCFGVVYINTSVPFGSPLYYCGSNPTNVFNLNVVVGPPCFLNVCI